MRVSKEGEKSIEGGRRERKDKGGRGLRIK